MSQVDQSAGLAQQASASAAAIPESGLAAVLPREGVPEVRSHAATAAPPPEGDPGEAAAGQAGVLESQLHALCNDLWDVHALLGATMARITELEEHGTGDQYIGSDAACTVRRLVDLARDTLGQLASTGKARESAR